MPPLWRQAFNKAEGVAAPVLEQATRSDRFVDVMAAAARVRKALATETEKASRRWLHLWNLPAAGDMAALRRQLAGLEREVRHLRRQLEGRGAGTDGHHAPAPRMSAPADRGSSPWPEQPVATGHSSG